MAHFVVALAAVLVAALALAVSAMAAGDPEGRGGKYALRGLFVVVVCSGVFVADIVHWIRA